MNKQKTSTTNQMINILNYILDNGTVNGYIVISKVCQNLDYIHANKLLLKMKNLKLIKQHICSKSKIYYVITRDGVQWMQII